MTTFGYHASHEQHRPSALLEYVRLAEAAGFEGAMCSDHFHPWTEEQGQSGFAWSWLGAALEATSLSFGTVNAPGQRYHPTIIAQAAATLAEMYPDRFWIAVGSGEALNEAVTGAPWPTKVERNARLAECVAIMRALWRGETVTHRGHVVVEDAKLYTRPERAPLVVGAALSEETATFVGGWADGLVTVGGPPEQLARMTDAFRRGGGEGKPIFVQHVLSWAATDAEARRAAHEQWRFSAVEREQLADLRCPAHFAAATRAITPDHVAERVRVSADPARHAAWLHEYADAGVEAVYILNVGLNQREYIDTFGARVLPELQ